MRSVLSLWGCAGAAGGGGDGHGEADPDEEALLGGVGERGHDADDLPTAIQEGAARAPGVDGRVELDEAVQRRAALDGDRAVEPGDDAGAQRGRQRERV